MHGMEINNYNQGMMPLCCMILALTIFKVTTLYAIPRDRFTRSHVFHVVQFTVHAASTVQYSTVNREKLMSFYCYMGIGSMR